MASSELQVLHASDLEGGVSTPEDAPPRFSAIVNGLESEYPDQTLVLSSGDNYIPGPFLSASTDPSLNEVLGSAGQGEISLVANLAISEAIAPSNAITLTAIGTYETGVFDESAAEIVAYDPDTQRLFVVSANNAQINVLDASDPTNLTQAFEIDITPYGAVANSVAIRNGLVAVAVENEATQSFGAVVFFDTDGEFLNLAPVGALPDMLTFTPDGKKVLVANEGEPNTDYTFDPEGSISIVDLSGGVENLSPNDVTFVDFRAFNAQEEALTAQGIRIFGPNASVAQDLEPEYITVSEDSTTAWIALQENNAFGVLDISSGQITDILPLGFKDHSIAGNGLDVSDASVAGLPLKDRDDAINIANYPNLFGVYQPDGIASYKVNGETFIISANEGDSRDYDAYSEEARVADLVLDPTAFPDAAELQADQVLGRLIVTTANGDADGDGDFDKLYALGGRSFSIWGTQGNLVYDSGDDFEQITASLLPEEFNSDNSENNSFDNRSDNKGPEPEGVTTGVIDGRTYAFIGLERVGGVMVYDVTNPVSPTFVQYVNNRDFAGDAAAGTAGDLGPEGLTFIAAEDSPNGRPLLAVANEVSGTTTLFEIANILNGSNGQNTFSLADGNGDYIITEFGGVGTGARPSLSVIAEVDTLKFVGEGLTAQNLLLTQQGSDLLVTFVGSQNLEVSLKNFDLEDLENLRKSRGATIDIGNILFDGQNEIRDSFDVFNANQDLPTIFNRNTVTFLNDLDNTTSGWDDSNDVINGQGGNDTLRGLSGDDILRGGSGNNQLFGDEGDDILFAGNDSSILTGGDGVDQFWIADNSLPEVTHTITDYQIGTDVIGIGGLAGVTSFSNLSITQSGANTLISVPEQDLAILTGIQATSLNSSSFVFA